jgi:predicted MFS family arabinose efflux permease
LWAAATLFVVNVGFGLVLPWTPQLAGSWGPNAAALGALLYGIAKLGVQASSGASIDRTGPGPWLRASLWAYSLSLLVMLAGTSASFAVGRLLEGLATGIVYVAVMTSLAEGDAATAGTRAGKVAGIGTAGLLAGPGLAWGFGEQGPSLPVAGVAIVAFVLSLTLGRFEMVTKSPSESAATVRHLLREPRFLLVLAPVFFGKLSFTALEGILPFMGPRCCGAPPNEVASWLLMMGLVFGIAQPVGGALSDRIGSIVLGIALPLVLGGLLIASFDGGTASVIAGLLGYAMGQSLAFAWAMRQLIAVDWGVGSGRAIGFHGSVTDLATLVGPTAFVLLYDRIGSEALMVLAMVAAAIGGFVIISRGSRAK